MRSVTSAISAVVDPPAVEAEDGPVAPPAESRADRFMRRLLRVSAADPSAAEGAHRAFRWAIAVSAVRCIVSYVLVPVLIPIVSLSGLVAAPISIALAAFAVVNGVISVRRFWVADHRRKWMYTWFMAAVFAVLLAAIALDATAWAGLR